MRNDHESVALETRRRKRSFTSLRLSTSLALMSGVRLQKILSAAGVASRRAAEVLIQEGRVTVNGITFTAVGSRADPFADDIRVDGRRVKSSGRRRYFLLNKPRGYVTTRIDPQGRKTVLDLLTGVREYVYPVGRLDYDSEGLLLLTNDGDLAARLTHPRHGAERVYEARVRGVPKPDTLRKLARGVGIGGARPAQASVQLVRAWRTQVGDQAVIAMSVREGRNRQVRRMCQAVGHPVVRLRRVQIGSVRDPRLKPGQFRELSPKEVEALRNSIGP